ncbi:MAG: hypothetical protein Alpg2KO_17760 [Alphaproteobacteria bacterium]
MFSLIGPEMTGSQQATDVRFSCMYPKLTACWIMGLVQWGQTQVAGMVGVPQAEAAP